MIKKTHDKLQSSIDKMQEHHQLLSEAMQKLCVKLGDLVGYKHDTEKREHRILVATKDFKEYDVDDLIEQAEKYTGGNNERV